MTDGIFIWWKKSGYFKNNQKLDKMEVLGNILMELFFDSSLRFDEIELVASLMCLYQSEVTLLLFRWQSKNWKIVYKNRKELWSKYEDMNRVYFLWHLLSSGITFWKAFLGILSPANFHNTYLILLFIAQITLCFNCLSFC